MGVITAKQLKQKTGEIIKRVMSGEKMTITYRGKPVAVIAPTTAGGDKPLAGLRTPDQAWQSIEDALEKSEPAFKSWQEATAWARNRNWY